MDKNIFTNSAGKSFPIVGLSPMEIERIRTSTLDKFRKLGRRLTKPTYTAITADGTSQTFEHNESTVESDEDRKALADYDATMREIEVEGNTKLSRAAMMCVDCDPMLEKRWLKRMAILEMDIPTEDFECLMLFVETEVLKSVVDIASLITAVLYSGGTVDESGVSAAEAAFRGELSKLYGHEEVIRDSAGDGQ